jgi:hypothetical protein
VSSLRSSRVFKTMTCLSKKGFTRWPSQLDDRNASRIFLPCGHAASVPHDFAAGVLLDS